ncbi:MAG: polymerase factor sigma-32 [Rickettsiaceae bacterium]|jgi:RNA polymerase sigma-32 factor|nr:polymerase factor sigma-32 [Rickettsiaceae bacterium]
MDKKINSLLKADQNEQKDSKGNDLNENGMLSDITSVEDEQDFTELDEPIDIEEPEKEELEKEAYDVLPKNLSLEPTITRKFSTSLPGLVPSENGFSRYLQQINNIPSLTQEEEFLLAKNYYEQHDLEAAHRLVTSHLKLVVKIALSYRNYGLPMVELVSEGNIGLMKAVKKYNPDLGHRLSTYAMWWIKASIQEYVLKSWSLVKLGTTAAQKKLFFSLGKLKHRIRNLHSRDVNEQDYKFIARELGVTEQEVSEMDIRLSNADLSLHAHAGNDDDSSELIEFVPEARPSPEALIATKQDSMLKRQLLAKALSILNERELHILQQRKLTTPPATLKELSIQYDISEERVRQIENKAFEKIQAHILSEAAKLETPTPKNLIT